MNKPNRHRPSALWRIERKCDRILSELLILRHRLTRPDIDTAIDALHRSARIIRQQSERERDLVRGMFHRNDPM